MDQVLRSAGAAHEVSSHDGRIFVTVNDNNIVLDVFDRGVEHSFAFLCRDQLKEVQS